MSRPWLLPNASGFCFVFLSKDRVDKNLYRQIPSSRAVEMLNVWLVSQRADLQAMVEALSDSCVQTEGKDQLRRRLVQAFLSNDLMLFESRIQTPAEDYELYFCIVKGVAANLEQRELQIRVAMSIGKRTREETIELINKGIIPSLMDVQVSASGVAHVALWGSEYALLTGKDLSPEKSNGRQGKGTGAPMLDVHDDTQSLSKWAKVYKAFSLSAGSWPGQTYEAAKQAFNDPRFIASLVAVTGFYVFLCSMSSYGCRQTQHL